MPNAAKNIDLQPPTGKEGLGRTSRLHQHVQHIYLILHFQMSDVCVVDENVTKCTMHEVSFVARLADVGS